MEIYQSISISIIFLSYLIIILSYLISGTKEYRNLLRKVKDIIINHKYRDLILILIITMIFLSPLLGYYYIFYLNIPLNMLLILAYIYSIFCLYLFLYQLKRLDMSFVSFISFLFNLLFLSLFIFGFYNLAYGLDKPIYLEDLSLFSFYRYLILVILSFCALFLYISSKYVYPQLIISFQWITFPYLKHYMLPLLDCNPLKDFCCYLIDTLSNNKKYFLIFIDIFFSYIITGVNIVLFFNFIVNGGDLRWNLYLLPFSFIAFIYSYAKYFFLDFFEGHCNFIRQVLFVIVEPLLTSQEEQAPMFIKRPIVDLRFRIQPYGYDFGYSEKDLSTLAQMWVQASDINCNIIWYKDKMYPINNLIVSLRLTSWVFIIFYFSRFLNKGLREYMFKFSQMPTPVPIRTMSIRAYFANKQFEKKIEEATQGAFKKNHPIVTDMSESKNEEVKFLASTTHGSGGEYGSRLLHPTLDLSGKPRTQNACFPFQEVNIKQKWLNPVAMVNSEDYFELPEVRHNLRENLSFMYGFVLIGEATTTTNTFRLIGKPYNPNTSMVIYQGNACRDLVPYSYGTLSAMAKNPNNSSEVD